METKKLSLQEMEMVEGGRLAGAICGAGFAGYGAIIGWGLAVGGVTAGVGALIGLGIGLAGVAVCSMAK